MSFNILKTIFFAAILILFSCNNKTEIELDRKCEEFKITSLIPIGVDDTTIEIFFDVVEDGDVKGILTLTILKDSTFPEEKKTHSLDSMSSESFFKTCQICIKFRPDENNQETLFLQRSGFFYIEEIQFEQVDAFELITKYKGYFENLILDEVVLDESNGRYTPLNNCLETNHIPIDWEEPLQ